MMEPSYTPQQTVAVNVPPEIKRWNWGAFLLNWIWGIAHNTFIALLVFVPFIGLIMPFVLGVKGNEWAWKNGEYASVEAFLARQRKWSWAGLIVSVGGFCFALLITASLFLGLAKLEPVGKALEITNNNTDAVYYLGKPIEQGMLVTGSVHISGPSGEADLAVPVHGSKAEGMLYITAKKALGAWIIEELVLEVGEAKQRINLLTSVI